MHHWQPKDRHHGITDELLHRTAVALDDRLHPLEIAPQQCAQRLRIDRLAQRRRPRHITEEHRHDFPLRTRPLVTNERRTARVAELRGVRILAATRTATQHKPRLGPSASRTKISWERPALEIPEEGADSP
jgi:hypothetical protein